MHAKRLLTIVAAAAHAGCYSQTQDVTSTSTSYVVSPSGSSPLGTTSALISGTPNLEGYWRLGEAGNVLPPPGGNLQMFDSSSNDVTGQYQGSVNLGVPGALVGDSDTAAHFQGGYGRIPDQKEYSLTRTWDAFERVVLNGTSWGTNPSNEPWIDQVTNQNDYGVEYGVDLYGDSSGIAYINPNGASGSFQQGIPSTTLLHGEMQIRGLWNARATGGPLQPISLVAQQVDVHNHVRAELIEHDDHTMEIDLIKVVNGQNTYVSIVNLDASIYTNNIGDWWFLRFRFDGPVLSAKAWKLGICDPNQPPSVIAANPACEPTAWQATGTAASADVGGVAVRSANSNSAARPVVYFDDFWVQTTGFSASFFVRVDPGQSTRVYALSKLDGDNHEYEFRLDGGNILKAYVYSPLGGYGAGRAIENVQPNKWYYIVIELDAGDYNDLNAGIRLFANGLESPTDFYKGDYNCPGHCPAVTSDGELVNCNGNAADGICWMINPVSGNADIELAAQREKGPFLGSEDELALFARLLTCDEVASIYNSSCASAQDPVVSGLFATASAPSVPNNPPARAVDNSPVSTWTSANNNLQYFTVDLGFARDVSEIKLIWGSVYATDYDLQISLDNVFWSNVASVSGGSVTSYPSSGAVRFCEANVVNGDGGTDDLCVASNARYIRLYLKTANASSGFSIAEFQVFACDIAPAACVNRYPIAHVGPQQIAFPGETVPVTGVLSSDPEGGQITYQWADLTKPSGSSARLSVQDAATATFVPDVVGTYSATLVL